MELREAIHGGLMSGSCPMGKRERELRVREREEKMEERRKGERQGAGKRRREAGCGDGLVLVAGGDARTAGRRRGEEEARAGRGLWEAKELGIEGLLPRSRSCATAVETTNNSASETGGFLRKTCHVGTRQAGCAGQIHRQYVFIRCLDLFVTACSRLGADT